MARIKFDELTKAEQRVVIAKDLLARLRSGRFTPRNSIYLSAVGVATRERDARKALKSAECRGCQIGGFFLCALDRHNKLELPELGLYEADSRRLHADDVPMRVYLMQWFSDRELEAVEAYFEGWEERGGDRFAKLVARPIDRMRMIAENIVEGQGRFSTTRLMKTARTQIK